MISSRYAQSKKKRKIIFSRKKIMHGGQIVPINILQTYVYVNLNVTGSTVSVNNITNSLVKSIATNTPGSIILSVDPSLSTLADYTLFGYNSATSAWAEIPRTNIDAGGSSVALYGNVPGMLIRKQKDATPLRASMEISIPVPASTYGNIMQFVNITDSIFEFTATNSPVTATNVYVQLIFTNSYATTGTKLSGWVPTYIPGLSLWLNASEPGLGTFSPNTGVKMTSWADKSGKNNHASAASNTAPLYQNLAGGVGMGMYFNGSTFFSGNMQATGKYSYTFSVARPDPKSPASGRLLSLGATGVDDSNANSSMGVAASAAGLATPATPMLVIGQGAAATNKIVYSNDGGTTWAAGTITPAWPATGSVSSIAYNGYMYVAVGDDGTAGGVIKYSTDGMTWNAAIAPAGNEADYGFYYNSTVLSAGNRYLGYGAINVVIYTGTMWICGGRGNGGGDVAAMAYSYNGINWILNTTTLPFKGSGNCIRSIATNGKMLILAGLLNPSMAYSYDGINWFAIASTEVTRAMQLTGINAVSGIHCVTWSSGYNMWIAAGDGGNLAGTMAAADANKKIAFSLDGFTWNAIANSGTPILADGIGTTYSAAFSITRIFSFNVNGVPTLLLSGPTPFNNRGASGPLISTAQTPTTANPYGFKITNCGGFPVNGSAPAEVSAAYASGSKIYVGLQTVSGSSFLFSSTAPSTSWTAVTTIPGTAGPINAMADNTNPNTNFQVNSYLNGASTTASIKDTTTTLPYIVSAWTDGANTCVAINGTQVPIYKVNPAQFNISSYMIGKNQGTNYNNYTGYIYEIVNCSGAMYAIARTVIEGYLSWKWAIQSLLPASHPFYARAPTKYSILTPWPLILTDLMPILWLDGQDPNGTEIAPPDRTLISTWYDKSGKGKNLTAPSGSEPMFRTNVLSGGALQFNRYPYQSMSLLPVPIATDTLTLTATTTATNWIPGLYVPASASVTYARPNVTAYYNGFIFFAVNTALNTTVLMQYDETNCQTRLLYSIASSLATGIYINSTTGIIYFVTTTGLKVLSPSALPITTSTTYTIVGTPLLDPSSTAISTNLGGIVADASGNVYIWPSANFNNLYRFSLSNYVATSWTATISYPIAISINSNPFFAYSSIDNSISYAITQSLRCVLYLSTCVIFSGSVAGTTLTVSAVGSGTLQLGMMFFYCTAAAGTTYFYTITAFGDGTSTSAGTGSLGRYTVSGGTITAAQGITTSTMGATPTDPSGNPIDKNFVSAYVQLGSSSTIAATDRTQDGLFNASATTLNVTDPVANSAYTNYGDDNGNNFFYDPVGNYLLFSDGYLTDAGNSQRIKRVNLSTRQMTTIAGPVNNITNTATTIVPVTTERFPSVYESGSTTVYDTPFSSGSSASLSLIGNNTFYFATNSVSNAMKSAAKLTNFRATPSCMSGPLTISGPTVSVFIVYINKNTNKAILPHRTAYNTPILSLSTTSDYTVFTGYIRGTVLTITNVTSGRVDLGATLNTPLGGIIVSLVSGTLGNANSTYNISIPQIVASGTIKCSNGIDAINSTVAGTGTTTGATVTGAADANSASYISLYAKGGGTTVYRNNSATGFAASTSTDIASASPAVWPDSALPTVFMGTISGTTLTVTNMISGCIQVGAVLNTSSGGTITALGTGNGTNLGTYTISVSQTVATATNMTATMPPVLPDLLFYSCSASAVNTRLNGAATTTNTSSGSLAVSAIGLGLQPSNISRKDALLPNYFFDGVVCEVLVYNTDLTTDNLRLNLMEGYLAWKWGIQSKLAATHLYKTLLPTDFVAAAPSAITSITLVYVYDISFAVSWSGGNGAISYSYSLTKSGIAVTDFKIMDSGVASKSVVIYGLAGNSSYILTITANSTLKSTSSTINVTTKSWVVTIPYGLAPRDGTVANVGQGGYQNQASKDGVGADTNFSGNTAMTIDRYDNIYVYESWGVRCIRIISLSTNIVASIPYVELGAAGNASTVKSIVDKNGIIYSNNIQGSIMKMVPNIYPLTYNANNTLATTWTTTKFISASSSTSPAGAPTIISGVSTNAENYGIAVDSLSNLYFISVSGSTYSLTKVNVNNGNALTVISGVSSDIASKIFQMCFDPFNNLWASLMSINKILMVTPSGIATVYGLGDENTLNGPLSNFSIKRPRGISSDKYGTIYITEGIDASPVIRRITNGNVDTVLGDSRRPELAAAISNFNLSVGVTAPIPAGIPGAGGTFRHDFSYAMYNAVDSYGNIYTMPQHVLCKFSLA